MTEATTYYQATRRWPNGYTAKTYKLGRRLHQELMATATRLDVSPSDLVGYLLKRGLEAIASGALEVPTRPLGPLSIDYPPARE